MLARRKHRGFEGGFDRFRAGGREECFRQTGRQHARKPFEQLRTYGGRMHVAHPVHERRGLLGDGSGDDGVTVADVGHTERRGQIDIAIAVHVFDGRALCGFPEYREIVAEVGDVARLVRDQRRNKRVRLRTGDVAHDTFEILVHG
jgi:hypothetical protein